ncbi:TPA: hypothetical protein LTW88_000873 [Enterobacter hormaechei]|nr:hypothetical protein [Enterobacter hormaechei]ELC6381519.1 hypothetical protein [Enterobacter hormaechei]ELF4133189.1 hypothetical protein [Enterobacter hormaechei]PNP09244.1 hypothetical protein MC56_015320 [Enterobacter hormaechei]HBL6075343.1 hypothetical protein [Enterobacter hormaechei]
MPSNHMYASLLSYKNLKLAHQGSDLRSITEFSLYSDSQPIGAVDDDSVYCFLNMLPRITKQSTVASSITVRTKWYSDLNNMILSSSQSHTKDYHGGWYNDEIAALSSLLLGVRFHAGSITRHYDYYTGDFGRIQAESSFPPVLEFKHNKPIVPNAIKEIDITNLKVLNNLHLLSEKNFNHLIRAARSYQNALWICESSPNMSWLLMVSALECAASQWAKSNASKEERFKHAKPELYEKLDTNEFRHLIPIIANEFKDSFGATKKFVDFCLYFLPDEPHVRPKAGRIDWEKESLSATFKKIYSYRSKALHGGQPFPEPMCSHPEVWDGYTAERARACSTLGGTWLNEDVPINLNTFNFMTHSILNKWWQSLLPS